MRIFFVFFISCFFIQCVENKNGIAFGSGIENIREINVSDIAHEIKYVALETKSDCLLGRDLYDISLSEDYLFVRGDYGLYQFTLDGKFIREIGKKGQGPEELLNLSSVKYDNRRKEIYMNDLFSGKIKVFSFEGSFLRNIPVEVGEKLIYYDSEDRLFYMYPMFYYNKQNSNELIVYDERGERQFLYPFLRDENIKYPGFLLSQSIIYTDGKSLYYKNPVELTIYQLENGKKIPMYELNLGRYGKLNWVDDMIVRKSGNTGFGEFNEEAADKISFYNLFEWKNSIGFLYLQHNRKFAWYDKKNNLVCRIRGRYAKTDGFTDDLQNGYPILPRFCVGNQLIGYVPAAALIEEMKEKKPFDGSLKFIMDSLSEEDNPVLQIVLK